MEKKQLTMRSGCDNIKKVAVSGEQIERQELLKKVLDNRDEVCYNSNVPPGEACTL